MTVWKHNVSWDKFSKALYCPLRLKMTIDKEQWTHTRTNLATNKGKIVQKTFELYFNNQFNLKPGGQRVEILEKLLLRVVEGSWLKAETIIYPPGQDINDLIALCLPQVRQGYSIMREMGLLTQRVESEKKWVSVFRNFPMFCMLDFFVETPSGVFLYDGKGTANKDADERQLLYYALAIHATRRTVRGGGFIYWNHGFEKVDLSPKALKRFVDTDFERGRKVMEQFRHGVDQVPATPSAQACYFCNWRATCEFSYYKKNPPGGDGTTAEVGFG